MFMDAIVVRERFSLQRLMSLGRRLDCRNLV
jgi:hypothetical protein